MASCEFENVGSTGNERRPHKMQCKNCGWIFRSKYADPKMVHAACVWRGTPEQKAHAIAKNIAAGGCKTCGCHPRVMKKATTT